MQRPPETRRDSPAGQGSSVQVPSAFLLNPGGQNVGQGGVLAVPHTGTTMPIPPTAGASQASGAQGGVSEVPQSSTLLVVKDSTS